MAQGRFARKTLVLAAALACGGAQAIITTSGSVSTSPNNVPIGPGSTDIGDFGLFVGNGSLGAIGVDGGSVLRAGTLLIGTQGSGDGSMVVSGAGTRLELQGDGLSYGLLNRLDLGQWGRGSLTVANGAVLDGRANAAACATAGAVCNTAIGGFAGSDATLTITGAGSHAQFLRGFWLGGLHVIRPTNPYGTPGGTTQGRVNVLDGATMLTDHASLGQAPGGNPTGSERSFAEVVIRGPGSTWTVSGGTLEASDAFFNLAQHRNAWATTTIDQGGTLRVAPANGDRFSGVAVGNNGGRADMTVSGVGSRIEFTQESATMHVARNNSTGTLNLNSGATVDNLFYLSVGRSGGIGTLNVDGSGTRIDLSNTVTAVANGVTAAAWIDIGRQGGTGTVNVTNGARIDVAALTWTTNGTGMYLGRDAASAGTLNIGSGGVVSFQAASTGTAGPAEVRNPFVSVGRDGSGTLNVTGGGKLLMTGNAISTVADSRATNLYIGGGGDSVVGGMGVALVSGAGSEITLGGSDTFIAVGIGPQSSGQLTIANQGSVSAIGMNVGRSGGVGVLKVNNATLNFSGQQTSGVLAGAFLSIGRSGGIGVAELSNGSVVTLNNMGSSGAGLNLGGTGPGPLGDGSLTVSGGSQVLVQAAAGLGNVVVGRDGSAMLRVKGASLVDVTGGNLYVARLSGSDGTFIATENSVINAGWAGIGRDKLADGSTVDGGTATMVLNGATLNVAGDVVIGTNGFLGGTAGSINVGGTMHNHGIFSPGNSPGTFTINGNFVAEAGSRMILEVQANGSGGFDTDLVVFNGSSTIDLDALNIEFRFLGSTDPNAFQASGGFDIDTFLAAKDSGGQLGALDPALLADTTFSARADAYAFTSFTFDAVAGASFVAQPVPEPGAWLMMLAGGAALAGRLRRGRMTA